MSNRFARGDFVFDGAQKVAGELDAAAVHFDQQCRAGFRQRPIGDDGQHGGRRFDGAPPSEPGGCGDALELRFGGLGQVDGDDAESAGMNYQIGGAQGVFDVLDAADPDEFFKLDAGGGGRAGVERIVGVDQDGKLAGRGRGGEDGMEKAGSSARSGADDFGNASAGAIGGASGEELGRGSIAPELGKGSQHVDIRLFFAFRLSPGEGRVN